MTAVGETSLDEEQRPATATPFWRYPGFAIELLAGLAALAVRAWQSWGVPAVIFQDSLKNLESAQFGLFSADLWFGQRTPLVPLVLRLTGATAEDTTVFRATQVTLGALAFALLAATVGRAVGGAWRWVALALVLLFGLTTPVTMWDHIILTESLTITTLVFATVTAIWVLQRPGWGTVAGFLGACTALVMVRDTHIVLTGLVALGVAVWAVRSWRRTKVVPILALVVVGVLLVLSLFGRVSTIEGGRHIQPTRETLFVKILPYTDRFEWFADHGMPDAERLRALRPRVYPDPQTGTPLFPLPQYGDPAWPELSEWVRHDANGLYNRWMVTHPVQAVGDFFRRPKMIWNSASDSWVFYRNPAFKEVKLVDIDLLLFPPMGIVAVLAAGAAVLLFAQRPRWWARPVGLVSVVLLGTGVVHNLASYLGDPAEVSRHAIGSIVQLRLGLLLVIVLALPVLTRPAVRPRPEPATE